MERESARPAIDRMNPVGRIERLAVGALVDHRGLAKAPRERPELRQVGREPAQMERPVRCVERDDFLAFEHPRVSPGAASIRTSGAPDRGRWMLAMRVAIAARRPPHA